VALIDVRSQTLEELTQTCVTLGEPKFRGKQLFEWIWKHQVLDFDKMSSLPQGFREKLKASFAFFPVTLNQRQDSADGTVKLRIALHDELMIEAVLIPSVYQERFTACVSSQVGCSLSCKFCATGTMKMKRNLSAAEIYDQVILVNQICLEKFNSRITNIVYMGMGEPLLNFKNVLQSTHLIHYGLDFSYRRITISTAGIIKMIKALADSGTTCNLALSLHAANDEKRNQIMPINETNDLNGLMDALNHFSMTVPGEITFEYVALAGFNDSTQDALELIPLCNLFPVKVNIIEYNTVDNLPFSKSDSKDLDAFVNLLQRHGIQTNVRRSRGKDIDAACGQLANKELPTIEKQ